LCYYDTTQKNRPLVFRDFCTIFGYHYKE